MSNVILSKHYYYFVVSIVQLIKTKTWLEVVDSLSKNTLGKQSVVKFATPLGGKLTFSKSIIIPGKINTR